jgi:hypothetical protein
MEAELQADVVARQELWQVERERRRLHNQDMELKVSDVLIKG